MAASRIHRKMMVYVCVLVLMYLRSVDSASDTSLVDQGSARAEISKFVLKKLRFQNKRHKCFLQNKNGVLYVLSQKTSRTKKKFSRLRQRTFLLTANVPLFGVSR